MLKFRFNSLDISCSLSVGEINDRLVYTKVINVQNNQNPTVHKDKKELCKKLEGCDKLKKDNNIPFIDKKNCYKCF